MIEISELRAEMLEISGLRAGDDRDVRINS
jgi:hypothetical protein